MPWKAGLNGFLPGLGIWAVPLERNPCGLLICWWHILYSSQSKRGQSVVLRTTSERPPPRSNTSGSYCPRGVQVGSGTKRPYCTRISPAQQGSYSLCGFRNLRPPEGPAASLLPQSMLKANVPHHQHLLCVWKMGAHDICPQSPFNGSTLTLDSPPFAPR